MFVDKAKFHRSSFLVTSACSKSVRCWQRPYDTPDKSLTFSQQVAMEYQVVTILVTCYEKVSDFPPPVTFATGGLLQYCCLFVRQSCVSFAKFHESDTHARLVADMLATCQTILICRDGLKVGNILVTFAARKLRGNCSRGL